MQRTRGLGQIQIIMYSMLSVGILLVIVSAFYLSSFLAIFGLGIVFWGAILLYIAPSKHVPLTLLNASTDFGNIERILLEFNLTERGVYLPPQNLKNAGSSLVYIPEKIGKNLPMYEEINEKLFSEERRGLFLTPTGLSLSRLFEQELGYSFAKSDLSQLQNVFRRLLVEKMEIAKGAEMKIQGNTINVEITENILDDVCRQTETLTRTHYQVGCVLTSAMACAIAKASGKPVTIQKETRNSKKKITEIEYRIEEE